MSKLQITKEEEAQAVARIWNMGAESLSPRVYEGLEDALKQMCSTRHIDNYAVAGYQRELSGKKSHCSDCETSNAPSYLTGPCDCKA